MRITSSMMMKNYTKNLNSSLEQLNKLQNQSTTGRSFDKVSDNPVLAASAYKLRRQTSLNSDYTSNMKQVDSTLSTAETSMMSIHSAIQKIANGDCLKAITGTSGEDERAIIATELRSVQSNLVALLNTKYSDVYVFGGSGSNAMPFSCDESGNLLFRGADVTTGVLANEDGAITNVSGFKLSFGKDNGEAFNGYTMNVDVSAANAANTVSVDAATKKITVSLVEGATAEDLKNALNGFSTPDIAADFSKISVSGDLTKEITSGTSGEITNKVDLSALANEKIFADIGLGLKFNLDGSVNQQSAMDVSTVGLAFMGYGKDENGIPNNIYTLLGDLADALESSGYSSENVQPYLDSLASQEKVLLANITSLGVKTNYITDTIDRLDDDAYNLSIKTQDVEYVDLTEAIMDFKMQEFSYRAALQMSSSILQSTLLDYLS